MAWPRGKPRPKKIPTPSFSHLSGEPVGLKHRRFRNEPSGQLQSGRAEIFCKSRSGPFGGEDFAARLERAIEHSRGAI
jgi:hypothetical protein